MKKTSYIKTIAISFGVSLIGAFLASFTMIYGMSISENIVYKVFLQIFVLIIFASLLYSILWTEGERDINRIAIGTTKKDLWRGVKIGCILMVPYMLTSLFLVFAKLGNFKYGDFLYRICNAHFLVMVNAVLPYLSTNLASMTGINIASQMSGIINVPLEWWQIVVVTLYHLILPVICGVSYLCGFKEYDITHGLIYKRNKKKTKHA